MTSPEIPAVLVSRFNGFHRQFFSSKNGPRNHIDSMDQYFMNTDWHVEPRIFLLQAFLFSLQQYVSYFVDASLYLLYSGGTATPHWKIPSILQRNIFFLFRQFCWIKLKRNHRCYKNITVTNIFKLPLLILAMFSAMAILETIPNARVSAVSKAPLQSLAAL